MAKAYAIITFRDTGPLKSWADVRSAQTHNSRDKPIAHGNGVRPKFEIGGTNLVAGIKTALRAHGIDPARLRKNGVIAYEAVLTASPAFFKADDPVKRAERFGRWYRAQKAFLIEKYGTRRVVSLILHVDEATPHLHAVILPLALRVDGRSKDRVERWSLVGRTIAGPGEFDRLQDEYAQAMAPFGLVRGERKAGHKYKPVKEYLAELKSQEEANVRLSVRLERDLARLRDKMDEVEAERIETARLRNAARTSWLQARERLGAAQATLNEDRRKVQQILSAIRDSRAASSHFLHLAQQFPPARWTKQTLVMAAAAREVQVTRSDANATDETIELHHAWLAKHAGKGR